MAKNKAIVNDDVIEKEDDCSVQVEHVSGLKETNEELAMQLRKLVPAAFDGDYLNPEKIAALINGDKPKQDGRFYFAWTGKEEALQVVQRPSINTLSPDRSKSLHFDQTNNIIIVGDNLEALKLLARSYFSRIKVIYIDPPYNTGNDFVYKDNFAESVQNYLQRTGQLEEGKKTTTKVTTQGRLHSSWLSMMYPRLYMARMLLSDDGVIMVSIDDHEVHRLRMIMDEIFGEENFIGQMIWKCRTGPANNVKFISIDTEYILLYSKDISSCRINKRSVDAEELGYDEVDEYVDQRGRYKLVMLDRRKRKYSPSRDFPIYHNGLVAIPGGTEEENAKKKWNWMWSAERVQRALEEGYIVLKRNRNGVVKAYYKVYENVDRDGNLIDRGMPYRNVIEGIYSAEGTEEINKIFDMPVMSFPKPVVLVKHLLQIASGPDDIVLDFFAGSGTTGQAVWELNEEDGGNRRFILVQLDEPIQDRNIAIDYPTIADVCIERLRRVSSWNKSSLLDQDMGFKVFRIKMSNINLGYDVYKIKHDNIEEIVKDYLAWLGAWVEEPLVPGWQPIDLVYEMILKDGLGLNAKIEEVKIGKDTFYKVTGETIDKEVYMYFRDKIRKDTIDEIMQPCYRGKTFIMLDDALTDSDKINLASFVKLKTL